jgi:apolipoprotein N-acyltransferase
MMQLDINKKTYVIGAIGLLSMAISIERMIHLPLWGYWPMFLGLGFAAMWVPILFRRFRDFGLINLAVTGGLFMGVSFLEGISSAFSFVALVPLLFLVEQFIKENRSYWGMWVLLFWTFYIANVFATFWVMNTALAAGIFANVVNAFLMSLPIVGYAFMRKILEKRYWWIVFVSTWIAFEFFHFNWDLHWPWMTLGYAFSNWPWAIQWYDITGVLGGSLWILIVNWFLFLAYSDDFPAKPNWIAAGVFLLAPILFSLIYRPTFENTENPVEFLLVQPNYEPHYEKFEFTGAEQLEKITRLVESKLSPKTDVLVLPETVFTIRLNRKEREAVIRQIRAWQKKYPKLQIISGLVARRILEDDEESNKFTRTSDIGNGKILRWEVGNVAYYAGPDGDKIYYKSKLVPGAEFFPYYRFLFVFEPIAKSLGGSMEGFRTQEQAEVFGEKNPLAPIICYESIFGDYCREFVAKGADIFVIMTNDGWWDDTPGHRQHLRYAQVRAIESRRPIARAANTGITAFIDPTGKILDKTEYEEDAVLTGILYPQSEITFYCRWGDLIGRLSLFVMIVLLMQLLYRIFANRRDRTFGSSS